MAILDGQLEFSDAQSLASKNNATTTISTDVLDLGADGTDGWGNAESNDLGNEVSLTVTVNTALVGASAAIVVKFFSYDSSATVTSGTEIFSLTIPALSASGWSRTLKMPTGGLYRYNG